MMNGSSVYVSLITNIVPSPMAFRWDGNINRISDCLFYEWFRLQTITFRGCRVSCSEDTRTTKWPFEKTPRNTGRMSPRNMLSILENRLFMVRNTVSEHLESWEGPIESTSVQGNTIIKKFAKSCLFRIAEILGRFSKSVYRCNNETHSKRYTR